MRIKTLFQLLIHPFFFDTLICTDLHGLEVVLVPPAASVDELLAAAGLEVEEEPRLESVARPGLHGQLADLVLWGRHEPSGSGLSHVFTTGLLTGSLVSEVVPVTLTA